MTALEQAQHAHGLTLAALEALNAALAALQRQENELRRRYPASGDALERATISIALERELPALYERHARRRLSVDADIAAAAERIEQVKAEIESVRSNIARRISRTCDGGELDKEIAAIQADADRRIKALQAAKRDELGDLPGMERTLLDLGGALPA